MIMFFTLSFAQSNQPLFVLKSVSMQKWKGNDGLAGCRYYIKYETYTDNKGAIADTVWIGEKCFPISTFQEGDIESYNANLRYTKGQYRWTYDIYINEDLNKKITYSYNPGNYYSGEDKTKLASNKPPKYIGEALISYNYKGKRFLKPIDKISEQESVTYK
jgi:hypothetical protein